MDQYAVIKSHIDITSYFTDEGIKCEAVITPLEGLFVLQYQEQNRDKLGQILEEHNAIRFRKLDVNSIDEAYDHVKKIYLESRKKADEYIEQEIFVTPLGQLFGLPV